MQKDREQLGMLSHTSILQILNEIKKRDYLINSKLNLLLWAPHGSGDHYWGPGMSAYKMYKSSSYRNFSLSLAHGYKDHKVNSVFNNYYFITDLPYGDSIGTFKFLVAAKKWIKKNAHQFDAVHVLSSHHVAFLPALWFEEEGVPTYIKITSEGSGFTSNSLSSKLLGLKKYRCKNANEITGYISISRAITEELKQVGIFPEKIHQIPNGVDTIRFEPVSYQEKKYLREKLGLSDTFTVLFTGGFSERKNPSLLAEAFLNFSEDPNIQLLLVGPDRDDGREREKIRQLINKHGMSNVYLVPFVKNIERYYQASDLFVLPSDKEGLSNSLLEAQACGLPSLVTKISGSEDVIVPGENGEFITNNARDVSRKINLYYQQPERVENQSVYASQLAREKYSSELILQKHLSLFSHRELVMD